MSVDALTVERWVGEGIIKCAHIVLSSRVYRSSRTLPPRSRSNWFKLEVEEVDDAVADLAKYRHDVSQPLVIQILQQADENSGKETIVEQWDMQFDGIPPTHHLRTVSYDDEPTKIYKRMCVMARTLYSYVRVLPAYRLYRACRDHGEVAHNLTYRLLHKPSSILQSEEVGGRTQVGAKGYHVERYAFAPIETMTGSLQISVQYQPQVAPLASAAAVPASIPQHVITDYIRGPSRKEQQKAVIRRMSASAAPSLNVATSRSDSLPRNIRRDGSVQAGTIPQHLDVLAPHAEEEDGEQAQQLSVERRQLPPGAPATAARANPTDIPIRKSPLLVPTHPSSAPSDFAFARHSPVQESSPYTRHLACQVMKAPTLADEAWRQHSMCLSKQESPLHRVSASSSASCSSPVVGSHASQDAGGCRALVKRSSGCAAPRQILVQLDSSLESRRLYASPDGLLRASSGRSDVMSSKWGSPGTERASFHQQKLIAPPDSSQVQAGQGPSQADVPHAEQHESCLGEDCGGVAENSAGRSRVSTESSQSDVASGRTATSPGLKDGQCLQRQRSKLSTLAHSHTHDLSASAPLPAHAKEDRESEIKDFLLQLEQPVDFKSVCGQDHARTLVDLQIWADEVLSRWSIGQG